MLPRVVRPTTATDLSLSWMSLVRFLPQQPLMTFLEGIVSEMSCFTFMTFQVSLTKANITTHASLDTLRRGASCASPHASAPTLPTVALRLRTNSACRTQAVRTVVHSGLAAFHAHFVGPRPSDDSTLRLSSLWCFATSVVSLAISTTPVSTVRTLGMRRIPTRK